MNQRKSRMPAEMNFNGLFPPNSAPVVPSPKMGTNRRMKKMAMAIAAQRM